LSHDIRQNVVRLLMCQVFLCMLVAAACGLYNTWLMLSVSLGAAIVIIPNILFVIIFFFRWRERSRVSLLFSLYFAEVIKLIFSGLLAIFSVKLFSVSIQLGGMLAGMALSYILFWGLAFYSLRKRSTVGAK
jgi:F0F1-type ATP synthase assembly protein I